MATHMAFDGESFTTQEIEDNMEKLPTNLRWLLTDQYKVDKVHIAALVKQGYDNENRWRHLGNSREEFFESSKDVMNLQPTTRDMRKLRLQLVCVWSDCKDSAVESQRRESVATSLGISLPVDAGATRLLIDRVQAMSPGRTFKREERPTGGYLGFLEGILKSKDYRAEPLEKVVLEGDSKSKHSGSTTLDGTTITLELTAPIPKHAAHFKIKIKGMGMAWVAQSIKHQQLEFLKDLRVETYEAYGEYVCSDKVAMMQRDDGQYPAWDNVVEADLATRNDWWEDVIVRKLSLNYAILKSIGENETKTPSGNWQQMVVNKLALGGGQRPRQGQGSARLARQRRLGPGLCGLLRQPFGPGRQPAWHGEEADQTRGRGDGRRQRQCMAGGATPQDSQGGPQGCMAGAAPPPCPTGPKGQDGKEGEGQGRQSGSRHRQGQGHPGAVPGQVLVVLAREEDLLRPPHLVVPVRTDLRPLPRLLPRAGLHRRVRWRQPRRLVPLSRRRGPPSPWGGRESPHGRGGR